MNVFIRKILRHVLISMDVKRVILNTSMDKVIKNFALFVIKNTS
jgi:hypothetical protein